MSDAEGSQEDRPMVIPKIFINYVDTYSANAISKILSQSAPGISRMEGEEEEEEEGEGDKAKKYRRKFSYFRNTFRFNIQAIFSSGYNFERRCLCTICDHEL